MEPSLKINIEELPKETQAAIISAADFWKVPPAEAVRRILNDYLGRISDDLAHATGHLTADQSPAWMQGVAGMLRSIADDIDTTAELEKRNLAAVVKLQPETKP
jgi:hypothetical protein